MICVTRVRACPAASSWCQTYENDQAAEVPVYEYHYGVPSMGTLLALLIIPEDVTGQVRTGHDWAGSNRPVISLTVVLPQCPTPLF